MKSLINIPKLRFSISPQWQYLHIDTRLLKIIEKATPPLVWYRYVPFENFYTTINKNELYFSNPLQWDDPFESLMVKGLDYVFCKCFCCRSNENEDAGWTVYSSRAKTTPIIHYSINVIEFLNCLNNYCTVNGNASIYVGKVDYSYSRDDIKKIIYKNQNQQLSIRQLLSLLLLKRQSFAYENEIRIFVVDSQYKTKIIDLSSIGINFTDFIGHVTLPPLPPNKSIDNKTYETLQKIVNGGMENYIKNLRTPVKVVNSGLYRTY